MLPVRYLRLGTASPTSSPTAAVAGQLQARRDVAGPAWAGYRVVTVVRQRGPVRPRIARTGSTRGATRIVPARSARTSV